jgi:predicted Zn-dependent protease with MMP-like domain
MDLFRFEEALQVLDGLPSATAVERRDDASFHQDRALCLDRLDRPAEADREFREAARLDPEECPPIERLPRERFEALVVEALDGVPPEFDPYLRQVSVVVREYPIPMQDVDPFSLGLYSGVPRTERVEENRNHLDTIFIFKRNHELLGLDRESLREEVRKTVVHEIAHHFGFGEDDMGEYA